MRDRIEDETPVATDEGDGAGGVRLGRPPGAVRSGRWMARRDEPFAVFLFGILKYALC
jgi:hypothetical protein